MSLNIDDVIRKTKGYWYEDGLVEILAGLFFVAVGVFLLIDWTTPADAPWKWIFAPGLMVLTIIWVLSGRKLINWLKERITYPRTGYVAYTRQKAGLMRTRPILAAAVGTVFAVAIVAGLLYRQEIVRIIPLILGGAVAALLVKVGSDVGLVRFHVLAMSSLLLGGALAILTADMGLSIALYYAGIGLATAAAGAVTLIHYLRAASMEVGDD